jgi:hypothetical protein
MNDLVINNTATELAISGLSEELQLKILEASKRLQESAAASIGKIRLDAKAFILPDGTETPSFTAVIVEIKHANIYYDQDFEDGVTNPPACIAILPPGADVKSIDLTPHECVENPQHTNCKECPKFQWGSVGKGRKGKACGEHTLLAINIPSLGDDIYLIEEKKANSKAVDAYLNNVAARYGHPIAVLTKFSVGVKNKWEHSFETVGFASQELITSLGARIEEASNMIYTRIVESYRRGTAFTPTSTSDTSGPVVARKANTKE